MFTVILRCSNQVNISVKWMKIEHIIYLFIDLNLQGCYELVTSFMETNMGIIAGVAFGIAFLQVQKL